MKAMILAAGKGTRVRPITHTTPKPMIPILQKPVMEFLLELLREHGFTEIMVNVSHLAEEIENYFRDGQRFGVEHQPGRRAAGRSRPSVEPVAYNRSAEAERMRGVSGSVAGTSLASSSSAATAGPVAPSSMALA